MLVILIPIKTVRIIEVTQKSNKINFDFTVISSSKYQWAIKNKEDAVASACLYSKKKKKINIKKKALTKILKLALDFLLPKTNTICYKASFLPSALSLVNENYNSH